MPVPLPCTLTSDSACGENTLTVAIPAAGSGLCAGPAGQAARRRQPQHRALADLHQAADASAGGDMPRQVIPMAARPCHPHPAPGWAPLETLVTFAIPSKCTDAWSSRICRDVLLCSGSSDEAVM